jgi:hypothetical protein
MPRHLDPFSLNGASTQNGHSSDVGLNCRRSTGTGREGAGLVTWTILAVTRTILDDIQLVLLTIRSARVGTRGV